VGHLAARTGPTRCTLAIDPGMRNMGICIITNWPEAGHIEMVRTVDPSIEKGWDRYKKLLFWHKLIIDTIDSADGIITEIVVEKQPKFSPCKALVTALPYWCIAWSVKLRVVCSSQVRKYFKCPDAIIKDTKKCKGWAKDLVEKDFLLYQETNKLLDHNACDALLMATMHTKKQLNEIFLS
jgi:hypothetical protein